MLRTLISIIVLSLLVINWKTISPIILETYKQVDRIMLTVQGIFEGAGEAAEQAKEAGQKIKEILDEVPVSQNSTQDTLSSKPITNNNQE